MNKRQISSYLALMISKSDFLVELILSNLKAGEWGQEPRRGEIFLKEISRNSSKTFSIFRMKTFILGDAKKFKMNLCLNEYTSLGYFLSTQPDPLSKILSKYKGGVFIDIGANIGFYSLQAAQYFHQVECFEPDPYNYKLLKSNLELSETANITAFNFGLSDQDDKVPLWQVPENFGGNSMVDYQFDQSRKYVTVDVFKFDNLSTGKNKNISLIKIDVEGFEEKVITGMGNFLISNRPDLYIEISNKTQFLSITSLLPKDYFALCPKTFRRIDVNENERWLFNDIFFTTEKMKVSN